MSSIQIQQAHAVGQSEALNRMKHFETTLSKYKVSLSWSGYKAKIKGIGVSGSVDVQADSVSVALKLGMLARAAGVDAQRLQKSLTRRLAEAFES